MPSGYLTLIYKKGMKPDDFMPFANPDLGILLAEKEGFEGHNV